MQGRNLGLRRVSNKPREGLRQHSIGPREEPRKEPIEEPTSSKGVFGCVSVYMCSCLCVFVCAGAASTRKCASWVLEYACGAGSTQRNRAGRFVRARHRFEYTVLSLWSFRRRLQPPTRRVAIVSISAVQRPTGRWIWYSTSAFRHCGHWAQLRGQCPQT